ncbi:MAG TPA: CorA family divalent cation transporter [Gaiella sp.]|nr:CorA family divalent cation transporter [Gaiella sp.]
MTDALLFREDEAEEIAEWAECVAKLGKSSLLWIDLERPGEEEIARLGEALELADESLSRLRDEDGGPHLGDFGSYLHVTAFAPRGERQEIQRVTCLVSTSWVVTVRDGPVEVVDELRERAQGAGEVGRLDGLDFLADLLTWVLEGYVRAFEAMDVELEEIDERAMEGSASHERTLTRLVQIRAETGRLRRLLVAHREVLLALTRPELGGISTEQSAARFEALIERLGEITQAARDSRESVVGSFDVLMTQVGQRTNDIMKTLTLVSLLLLPGTLLAGILGMNFKVGLFDHPGFFWLALLLILAVALGTLVMVRQRRWI